MAIYLFIGAAAPSRTPRYPIERGEPRRVAAACVICIAVEELPTSGTRLYSSGTQIPGFTRWD